MMKLRVVIIEPNVAMRESLSRYVSSLGHEVIAISRPSSCPHYHSDTHYCTQEYACSDVSIVSQSLPHLDGIEFIKRRMTGGCKEPPKHVAIFCSPWSEREHELANAIGCRYFEEPLRNSVLGDWLDEIAKETPRDRKLIPLDEELPDNGNEPTFSSGFC